MSVAEIEEMFKKHNFLGWTEISAKVRSFGQDKLIFYQFSALERNKTERRHFTKFFFAGRHHGQRQCQVPGG